MYINGTEIGAMEWSHQVVNVDNNDGVKILLGTKYHINAATHNNGNLRIDEFGLWYNTLSASNISALFSSY